MTPERYQQVVAVFQAASDLEGAEQVELGERFIELRGFAVGGPDEQIRVSRVYELLRYLTKNPINRN